MRPTPVLSRRLATAAAAALFVPLAVALVTAAADPKPKPPADPTPPTEAAPLFAKTEPAANKPALVLTPDDKGVHGWVAGETSYADKTVTLKLDGATKTAPVRDDNTFTLPYRASKPVTVTATLPIEGGKSLTASAALSPQKPGGPSVFFVTDRSAYRPGHTLRFAAYLRTLTADGEFEPVRDKEVTVELTSIAKRTKAARLPLRTDEHGRVTGSYTFSDADALDHYTLTAGGYVGDAKVLLGEYRKTKVGLKIAGEVKGNKLLLTFDAKDYLDRRVKGTDATFTAQVTRVADPRQLSLTPGGFVQPEPAPPSADDLAGLPDDERMLALAHGVSATTFAGFGGRTVANREGKVTFAADGPGTVELDLHPDWLKGHHAVTVTGVLLDETGRENRSTATIDLDPAPKKGVKVTTSKDLVAVGEKLPVAVESFGLGEKDAPQTTLLVVRLDANPGAPWVAPAVLDDGEAIPDSTRLLPIGEPTPKKTKPAVEGWTTLPVYDPVKRKVLTALPVVNGKAEADLRQPGAYKLLAVTRLADDTVLQAEAGVVVKAPAKLPAVVLKLDGREVEAGTKLRGAVHTRFAGAKVLLTLRDATGVRLTKPLTANAAGVAAFEEQLPANLRYGCAVTAVYPESPTTIHADQRELYVVPTDRTITVTTKVPETVGPGAEVALDLSVNRAEPVDLVVSVYDESLLGVSGDLSKDIRDFYLADARGLNRAARELAATRLGEVKVADLVAKAEMLLKESGARQDGTQAVDPHPYLRFLVDHWRTGTLSTVDAVTLVRLAGFEVYTAYPYLGADGMLPNVPKTARLADLFRRRESGGYLAAAVVNNVVLIAAGQPGGDPWLAHRTGTVPTGFPGFGIQGFHGFGSFHGISGFGSYHPGISGFGGYPGWVPPGGFGSGFGGIGGISGFGGGIAGGIGGFGGGIQGGIGGIGGFGGGGFQPLPGMGGTVFPNAVAGIQGSFSYGFSRDFTPSGNSAFSVGPIGPLTALVSDKGPVPGLDLAGEVVRRDFADSAFWSAGVRTDDTGKATVKFKVPDSLTNWRVAVTAVSAKMHVGTGQAKFRTTRPVMIWPMLPRAFSEGDTVAVFGTVHNLSDHEQTVKVHLKAENGTVLSAAEKTVKVPARGNVPVYWDYKAGKPGMTDLLMSASCLAGSDASLKRLPIVADRVEERATASGLVGKGGLKVVLPDGFNPESATVTVTLAPSVVADMADTLPYLVDYPYGCVEQTMSRFLPAVKVAQILKTSGIKVPGLEEKLPKVVEAGIKRLLELQQPDGGWAWQGSGTTHEMMTPYALYGLLEAEKGGHTVPNEQAIRNGMARVRTYLDSMRPAWQPVETGDGRRATLTTQVNDTLYLLWVLSHRENVPAEWWPRIEKAAGSEHVSDYGHALALELAVKAGRKELADTLAAELRKRAKTSGDRVYWTTAKFSRWADNTFEVTAAALKALVAHNPEDVLIPGVLSYFQTTKRGDRWDSTKDTAVVLYALCDYLAAVKARPSATGAVTVGLNDGPGRPVALDGPLSKTVTLDAKRLKAGENTVTFEGGMAATGALARVVVKYTRSGADVPARSYGVKVDRVLSLRGPDGTWTDLKPGSTVAKGSFVRVRVTATGEDGALTYTLVESPKPAGGETVPADDKRFAKDLTGSKHVLREDREAMTCFHYEHSTTTVVAEYVFLTEFAGDFRLPPARVELMYRPTSGGHSDSFRLKVK